MNKKICMLTNTHNPLDHRVYYKESLSLKKNGFDVFVIGVDYVEAKKFFEKEIRIIQVKRGKNKVLKRLISLPFLYFEAKKIDCDIYHCHDLDAAVLGLFLKIVHKKKLVFDIHEYNSDIISEGATIPKILKPFVKKIIKKIDCFIAVKSDYVITVDESLCEIYKQYNKNCVSIKNFINYELIKNIKYPNQNKRQNYILYLGGISENRGIFKIIESIKNLKEQGITNKFLFVGGFINETEKNKTFKLIEKYNVEEMTKFIGKVPYEQIPKYLNQSIIGLLVLQPSERYIKGSYPVKLFEYMYQNLPVIASDFKGIKEIIKKERCGILINPQNSDELTKAIIKLLDFPDTRKKMGENGKKAVIEKYNWNNESKKLKEIYEII
jgi:glycosyltransferase involved in cell wall biosynthesis